MLTAKNGQNRKDIRPGLEVDIILKKDQLTNSSYHPHGIKVRLQDGQVGRVQEIIGPAVKT
jgi:uncharacterized repeat protein (TIGR03833 family)